jgi:hypothetical protein
VTYRHGLAAALALLLSVTALGIGSSHKAPPEFRGAPDGVNELISMPNWVGGFFVNQEDRFFYKGSTEDFEAFLKNYAAIRDIQRHRLTIHHHILQTQAYGEEPAEPADWMLEIGLLSWRHVRKDPKLEFLTLFPPEDTDGPKYAVEVHLALDGSVDLNKLKVPPAIEIVNAAEPPSEEPTGESSGADGGNAG